MDTITIKINNKSRFTLKDILGMSGYEHSNNKDIENISWLRNHEGEDVEIEIYDGKETTYHYVHISIIDGVITIIDTDI